MTLIIWSLNSFYIHYAFNSVCQRVKIGTFFQLMMIGVNSRDNAWVVIIDTKTFCCYCSSMGIYWMILFNELFEVSETLNLERTRKGR